MAEPTEAAEPTDKTDAIEPTLPIERTDPTLPIDKTDPLDPIDKTELSDHSDQRDEDVERAGMRQSCPAETSGADREPPTTQSSSAIRRAARAAPSLATGT